MFAKRNRPFRNNVKDAMSAAGAVLAVLLVAMPAFAQGSARGNSQPTGGAPLNQNQMMNMLDQVSVGKSPTLPTRPRQQQTHQSQVHSTGASGTGRNTPNHGAAPANRASGHSIVGRSGTSSMGHGSGMMPMGHGIGMLPMGHGISMLPMGHGIGTSPMGHGMGMSPMGHGMGTSPMGHGMGTSAMGHGMGMSAMGHGMGMSAMGHGMGTSPMGHGMGMGAIGTMGGVGAGMAAHSALTGGNAANFMQQLKQKLSAMQPQEGTTGEMPGMPGAGAAGGMQAQLMQRLFKGQSGGPGLTPSGQLGMPMARPSGGMGMGMNMGMPPTAQTKAPIQQFSPGSLIKRPPGINGITGGATVSSPSRSGPATSTASDLERQMEEQYGH
jgi:hypothetical protein